MNTSLGDQVVFVTGAASGIGRAVSNKLASLGARLVLTDVNAQGLAELGKHIASERSTSITLDVSEYTACERAIQQALKVFSRLDHVVNCAGINPTAYPLVSAPDDYYDRIMSVNMKGVYNVTRAAIPHMKEHAGCTFVNVSSVLGLKPADQMAIYCATKYAVVGFSRAMALELGPKGIRVNVVAPGYIDTPTNASVVQGKEAMESSAKEVALGRMGYPGEVADVVGFLMSKEARYMSGSVVEVHGAQVVHEGSLNVQPQPVHGFSRLHTSMHLEENIPAVILTVENIEPWIRDVSVQRLRMLQVKYHLLHQMFRDPRDRLPYQGTLADDYANKQLLEPKPSSGQK